MRAAPVIDPRFLSHPDDIEVMVRGFKLVRKIFAQAQFAPFDGDRADTIYHPAGTCRMGADANSVVDTELRVRGAKVCASSTPPSCRRSCPATRTRPC
jgi:choline dehydrogenase-like flavoprotein